MQIMKNLFSFCVFILGVVFMNGQQYDYRCGTVESTEPDPEGVYSYRTDSDALNLCEPIVFNLKFWGINRPNGDNDFPNRAQDALQGVANLNILYNQFGIYFKYIGYEEFNSPELPDDSNGYYILEEILDFYQMINWVKSNEYYDENAFNVYAFGWAEWGGGIGPSKKLYSGISSSNLSKFLLSHEIGHNLNLRHTRSNDENATRDPNNPHFNANTHGDRVVDTAANSGFWDYGCSCSPWVDPETCTYYGRERDPVGDLYQIEYGDVINVMGNAYECMEEYLTLGQGIRAREAIEEGHYDDAITDIAFLYEPYAGEYFVEPGTHEVNYRPLFQPGFDYYFNECCCNYPEPADYNDTSFTTTNNTILFISKFESDFNKITHPNHTSIIIDFGDCPLNEVGKPRKCYDNWNKNPNSGSITHFRDGVFNTNVSVIQKDSLGINNPNLIHLLESGLYNIEKRYNDGSKKNEVIFKEK